MKRPRGELGSLEFQFIDRDCADALADTVNWCLAHDARFSGEVLLSEFENARTAPFEHCYSHPLWEKSVDNVQLQELLAHHDRRIIAVGIWNAIGISKSPELVTFSGVSSEALKRFSNPIAIVYEGWKFSTPGYERAADRDAVKCYSRFLAICRSFNPAYAAILSGNSLVSPIELARGYSTRMFSSFFLSEAVFGVSTLAEIERMYCDAYTERCHQGLYVGTWRFAPKARSIIVNWSSVEDRSKVLSRIIARAFS